MKCRHQINRKISGSHITDLDGSHTFAFCAYGEESGNTGPFEMYLALPYITNILEKTPDHTQDGTTHVARWQVVCVQHSTARFIVSIPSAQAFVHCCCFIQPQPGFHPPLLHPGCVLQARLCHGPGEINGSTCHGILASELLTLIGMIRTATRLLTTGLPNGKTTAYRPRSRKMTSTTSPCHTI